LSVVRFCLRTTLILFAMKVSGVLLLGLLAREAVSYAGFFVGSGGCDVADAGCVEHPAEERNIVGVEIDANGSMSLLNNTFVTPGMPVWLTLLSYMYRYDCLFATLADTSLVWWQPSNGPPSYVESGGVNPVYSAVAYSGETLLVANYHGPDDANTSTGASVASFAIGDDCSLTLVDVKNHSGSSVNPSRQGGAHVHSVVPARDGLAYACDLGLDIIFTYQVGLDSHLTELSRTHTEPGVGPRHLVPHPVKPFVYVVTEMGQNLLVYRQGLNGTLSLVQTASLRADVGCAADASKSAEIVMALDGLLVFATMRGCQNTVSMFLVKDDGTLALLKVAEAPAFPRGMFLPNNFESNTPSTLVVGGQSNTELWSYHFDYMGPTLEKLSELHSTGAALDLPPHPAAFAQFPVYGHALSV